MPKARSRKTSRMVIPIIGVASTMMKLVEYMAQMNRGSRNQVKPGARILWIVTRKLSPVRIDENPVMKIPSAVRMTLLFAYAIFKGWPPIPTRFF